MIVRLVAVFASFAALIQAIYSPITIKEYPTRPLRFSISSSTSMTVTRTRRSDFDVIGEFGRLSGNTFTYRIVRYPRAELHKRFTATQLKLYVDEALRQAVQVWSSEMNVQFVECKQCTVADIEISFATLFHGDDFPFDGVGNEVAHAFYPNHVRFRGRIHIDDAEPWGPTGRNLVWVLAHELGHVLGLPHSDPQSLSIMSALYQGFQQQTPRLYPLDIRRIRTLYGSSKKNEVDTAIRDERHKKQTSRKMCAKAKRREKITTVLFDICKEGARVDAMLALPNGTVYAFRDRFYWRVAIGAGRIPGFPRLIADDWNGLPDFPDSAFTDRYDWSWMIKGNRVWQIDASTKKMLFLIPVEIRKAAPLSNYDYSRVGAILSILSDTERPLQFFFFGSIYWLDVNYNGSRSDALTRHIAEIHPSLNQVDAAVSIRNRHGHVNSYVFSGIRYAKVVVDDQHLQLERVQATL